MKRVRLMPLLAVILLIQGCASVTSTAVFYTPSTSVTYPPKPEGSVVPILDRPPARPYAEIGRFAFQTGLGYPFLMRALEYNARRVGADAVILRESKSWVVPHPYAVPPTLGWIPVPVGYGPCGGWYGGTATVPVWYPGYTGVNYDSMTGIDARMIIFR